MVCRTCAAVVLAKTPPCGPGMNPLFAEQYKVSPAKMHGLAVGLGGILRGRIARRRLRSRTATPVYSMFACIGKAVTWMVARAGVLPNSKRRGGGSFMTFAGILFVKYGFTNAKCFIVNPAASAMAFSPSKARSV